MNPWRKDFPILTQMLYGTKPLVYLDNGATSQKPKSVIQKMTDAYEVYHANVHRGVHYLSQKSSEEYENVRTDLCRFLGTPNSEEFVFTRGTTESLNLVAFGLGSQLIQEGDGILVTRMEHHANFVPWQQLAIQKKAHLRIVELTPEGEIDLEDFRSKLVVQGRAAKVAAFTQMSNVLGTVNPVREMAKLAKEKGAIVVVDGAQSIVHLDLRIPDLGPIDFFAFSAHKLFGPTGVGVLWGRKALLDQMNPMQFGGDMILRVEDEQTTLNEAPWKFEAGTPNFVGVIGMGEALRYLENQGRSKLVEAEHQVGEYALNRLLKVEGVRVFGPQVMKNRGAVFSFEVKGIHPHDLGMFLDHQGIAVRAGHHCAHPLMKWLGVSATTRASFSFYNTTEEADALVDSIEKAKRYFL